MSCYSSESDAAMRCVFLSKEAQKGWVWGGTLALMLTPIVGAMVGWAGYPLLGGAAMGASALFTTVLFTWLINQLSLTLYATRNELVRRTLTLEVAWRNHKLTSQQYAAPRIRHEIFHDFVGAWYTRHEFLEATLRDGRKVRVLGGGLNVIFDFQKQEMAMVCNAWNTICAE